MNVFEDIGKLVLQFENESLPKEYWTHHTHLAVGLYYVLNEGSDIALSRIRTNIKKYNIATGGVNTDTAGYHETITVFWIRTIDHFLQNCDNDLSPEILFAEFLLNTQSDKNLPFEYYTRDRLLCPAARVNYCEPDIKQLP